jgi:hypothetical protein
MKKIYLLAIGFTTLLASESKAQDTLVYESFNFQSFYDNLIDDVVPPPGVSSDPLWYSYDADGLTDGSAGGTRPGGWFAVQPFSPVDTTNNVSIAANSWFTAPAAADNWLISPSFTLRSNDTLYWKSAPSQTPRYLDGYKVYISTTTNDDLAFTGPGSALLFTAAEMTSLGSDTTYSTYGFSSGFVHGQDGTYIDIATTSAPILHNGQLRPMFVPLNAYAGQTIFIGFHQDSFDDNLISIDDFMIRGPLVAAGVTENASTELGLNVFPNPSADMAQVNYNLSAATTVVINIYDVTGKLISSENKGTQDAGRHFTSINTGAMANGFYTVSVRTANTVSTTKMIVK